MENKGFTLIELIVVMAIIAIIVLLAAPRFLGHTKDAHITRIKNDVHVVNNIVDEHLVVESELPNEWVDVTQKELEAIGMGGVLYDTRGVAESVVPGDYKMVETEHKGTYYANEKGNVYAEPNTRSIVVLDHGERLTSKSNEFVRGMDIAPILDEYGEDARYTLVVELRSKNISKYNKILIYLQTGSGAKHRLVDEWVPVTTEYNQYIIRDLKPSWSGDTNKGIPYTTSHLAFFGKYDSGNIADVRSIKLIVHLDE